MGFSLVVESEGCPLVQWTSHCGGFSRPYGFSCPHGLRSCSSQALELRLNNCATRLLPYTWTFPDQGSNSWVSYQWGRLLTSEATRGTPSHFCLFKASVLISLKYRIFKYICSEIFLFLLIFNTKKFCIERKIFTYIFLRSILRFGWFTWINFLNGCKLCLEKNLK